MDHDIEALDMTIVDKRGKHKEQTENDEGHGLHVEDLPRVPADTGGTPALTAFAVVIDHLGGVQATADLEMLGHLVLSRTATLQDMYSASATIMKDISGQELSVRLLNTLQQQAVRTQEAITAAQIQQHLNGAPARR